MICRIVILGTRKSTTFKKAIGIVDISKICSSALSHEQHLVKQLHNLAAGLVDGADHSPALAGQGPQYFHHTGGHEAVQARGGLITEHQGWVGQNLRGQGQPLHLASRNALHTLVRLPNDSVSTFG